MTDGSLLEELELCNGMELKYLLSIKVGSWALLVSLMAMACVPLIILSIVPLNSFCIWLSKECAATVGGGFSCDDGFSDG